MQLAEGSGCTKIFRCTYHGWAYRLDGTLRHIPHRDGFPDTDDENHGLVPVDVVERHGLVFVTQEEPIGAGALDGLDDVPPLLTADQAIFASSGKSRWSTSSGDSTNVMLSGASPIVPITSS